MESAGHQKLVEDDDPRPALPKKPFIHPGNIMLGKGVLAFDYHSGEGKKHTISNAHYKDIVNRKYRPTGEVDR